jgi:hypothetical protein
VTGGRAAFNREIFKTPALAAGVFVCIQTLITADQSMPSVSA